MKVMRRIRVPEGVEALGDGRVEVAVDEAVDLERGLVQRLRLVVVRLFSEYNIN